MPETDPAPVRSFAEWLHELRGGAALAELSGALHELIGAVEAFGKPGELRLTLKVKPEADAMVSVVDDVVLKKPTAARKPTMWFVDEHANLRRNDPRQQAFELRALPPRDEPAEITKEARDA